jgi:lipopolysaccharide export system protein LptA
MKLAVTLALMLLSFTAASQAEESVRIEVIYGGFFSKSEKDFPGASIFEKDESGRRVHFRHNGAELKCDKAYLYSEDNRLEAYGAIYFTQGDTITLTSSELKYNGQTKIAQAIKNVTLISESSTLTTDLLFFDREKQEAFYPYSGTLIDSVNTLKSKKGTYLIDQSLYRFNSNVTLENKDFNLTSDRLDYYTKSEVAEFFGPTTIIGDTYTFYFELGRYETANERGYGKINTRIDYDKRIVKGDSIYFDRFANYAASSGNVLVTDSINQTRLKAQYVEVFKEKDSLIATDNAIIARAIEKDSLYVSGSYIYITGPEQTRDMSAYPNAQFFKNDMSGKSDSLLYFSTSGITELVGRPVLWSGESQLTGKYMYFTTKVDTGALDSLYVNEQAFIASKDTISEIGFNQAKGVNLRGKFTDNALSSTLLDKNAEVIYYLYDDKEALIGINQTSSSSIKIDFDSGEISRITFLKNPNGTLYPYESFPKEKSTLEGFQWIGDQRANTLVEWLSRIKQLKK